MHQEDQSDPAIQKTRPNSDLGLAILNQPASDPNSTPVLKLHSFLPSKIKRDSFIKQKLEPGDYMVVPISTARNIIGLKGFEDNSDEESEMENFIRYVATKKFTLIRPQTILSGKKGNMMQYSFQNPYFVSVIEDLFNKRDMDNDGFVDQHEFGVLARSLSLKSQKYEFSKILELFEPKKLDGSRGNGLSLKGFKAFFLNFLEEFRPTREWVEERLARLGYDTDFYSFQSRVFGFGIYSKGKVKVTIKDALKGKYFLYLRLK